MARAQPKQECRLPFGKRCRDAFRQIHRLARVMSGKYDWKPGEGVRSVGDVFNLIVMENGTLARCKLGHTEYGGTARAHHRSGEIAGGSQGFSASICKKRLRDFPTTTPRRR